MKKVYKNIAKCFTIAFLIGGMYSVLYCDSAMWIEAAVFTCLQWMLSGLFGMIWIEFESREE